MTTATTVQEDEETKVGPLHEAHAAYLKRTKNVDVDPETIFLVYSTRTAFRGRPGAGVAPSDEYRGVAEAKRKATEAKVAEKAKAAEERKAEREKAAAEKEAARKAKAEEAAKAKEAREKAAAEKKAAKEKAAAEKAVSKDSQSALKDANAKAQSGGNAKAKDAPF